MTAIPSSMSPSPGRSPSLPKKPQKAGRGKRLLHDPISRSTLRATWLRTNETLPKPQIYLKKIDPRVFASIHFCPLTNLRESLQLARVSGDPSTYVLE